EPARDNSAANVPPIAPAPAITYLNDFPSTITSDNIAIHGAQENQTERSRLKTERATEQIISLYYDLYTPDHATGRRLPLLIALHGYEGTKESMMSLAQKINSTDFAIVSLQGPNAFFVRENGEVPQRVGFGWMMQYKAHETIRLHHDTLLSIISELAAEDAIDQQRIFLLGFSQSVALNYRFAFTYPDMVRGVVAVCGGIPGDWDQEKYHECATDVLIIAGETDDFYPLARTSTFSE